MTPRPLTDRQQQVLEIIKALIRENGFPPTCRELCDAMGWKSTNAAAEVLRALEQKHAISMKRTKARSIRVLQS